MVRRDARILVSPHSTIIDATQAALDLLGLTLDELKELPSGGLSPEEDKTAFVGFLEAWQDTGGGPIFGAGSARLSDGRLIRVRYVISPMADGNYEVTLERSGEPVSEPPRTFTLGKVLSTWRAPQRKLAALAPDSPEWLGVNHEIDHFRSEYPRVAVSLRATRYRLAGGVPAIPTNNRLTSEINQFDSKGKKTGAWEEYFSDETLSGAGQYADGEKSGPWKYSFRNGKIKAIGDYSHGELTGPWIWYRESGALLQVGGFLDGRKAGPWKRFRDTGELVEQSEYVDGKKSVQRQMSDTKGAVTRVTDPPS